LRALLPSLVPVRSGWGRERVASNRRARKRLAGLQAIKIIQAQRVARAEPVMNFGEDHGGVMGKIGGKNPGMIGLIFQVYFSFGAGVKTR